MNDSFQPISTDTTLRQKTGSWKYLQPVYHNKAAPCRAGCPTGNDIPAIVDGMMRGKLDEALERLLWENPFPSITGRVCHHPCEASCNRTHYDVAVSIHQLERFLGDYGLQRNKQVRAIAPPKGKRVAVAGSGPAGLAAAYHLARLGYEVTVFEAQQEPGGVLRYGIPENRLPKEILRQELQKVYALGVRIRTGQRLGEDVSLEDLKHYDAVFLATGAGQGQALSIPGQELAGVLEGLEFLRTVNEGHAPQPGPRVCVIGGGNTAMDVARTALRLGKQVSVLYRRTRAQMPAIPDEVEEALAEGVQLHELVAPVRVLGSGAVTGVELVRMQLGAPDASGRRQPVPIENSNFRLQADAVITAIGEAADLSILRDKLLTGRNVLRVDQVGRTSDERVFAGGDLIDQPHTVVDAIASGKRAAMAIDLFLRGKDLSDALDELRVGQGTSLSMRRYALGTRDGETDLKAVVQYRDLNTDYFKASASTALPQRQAGAVEGDFSETVSGYNAGQALGEAERCFQCGLCTQCDNCLVFCPDLAILRAQDGQGYLVNYDYCKGCGICAFECPRQVIDMVRQGL